MSNNNEKYKETLGTLELLLKEAFEFSKNTTGIQTYEKKKWYASHIFTKIILCARAIWNLLPKLNNSKPEVWDLPSICVLCRSLIESYLIFYYLVVDDISDEEREWRCLVCENHAETERLKMLQLALPNSQNISKVGSYVQLVRDKLKDNPYLKHLGEKERKTILNGKKGILLSKDEIADKSGIKRGYYKGTYKYLSQYIHTSELVLQQMDAFRAGDQQSLKVISTIVSYTNEFAAFSIRDFERVFPDKVKISDEVKKIIGDWEYIQKNWRSL